MDRLSLENNIYSDVIEDSIKAFIDKNLIDAIKIDRTERVLPGMEYRVDKIAEYYLGSAEYSWAILLVNDAIEGLSYFKEGRRINIPDINYLK